jgi:predicted TIM-barrel fold metal-dependent hydrolase
MSASPNYISIRPDWLATRDEDVLDPAMPIVDTHHHLYDRPAVRYLLDDYLRDIETGHDVRASVFVQARSMLRADVPADLQPIGEVEFVNGVAAMSASGLYGPTRVCAGIVGFADLTLGAQVRPILERLILAGGGLTSRGGRFCGIRQTLCWDADTPLLNAAYPTTETMVESEAFRLGFAQLAPLGLKFEAWAFFHQLPAVARLARDFPETGIVLNHLGGILRIREYADRPEAYEAWKNGISDLARSSNVVVKLSGLGMRIGGFGFEEHARAPNSEELAEAWRPWVEHAIEAFGPDRCMFGSNFPVDKGSYSFKIGVNAVKRLVSGLDQIDRERIFWRTAKRVYDLPDAALFRDIEQSYHPRHSDQNSIGWCFDGSASSEAEFGSTGHD